MVTPISTFSTSLGKAFPLFNSLLKEGRDSNLDPPQCPATAPILGTTVSKRHTQGWLHTMAEQGTSGDGNKDPTADVHTKQQTPITLQDPPKSKLKRQLSIDTAESTESQRVRKKLYVDEENVGQRSFSDEVDGGPCIPGLGVDAGRSTSGLDSIAGKTVSVTGVDVGRSSSGISIQVEDHGKRSSVVADSAFERRSGASAPYIIGPTNRQFSTESSDQIKYSQDRVSLSNSPSKQPGSVLYQTCNTPHRQDSIKYQAPNQGYAESRSYHYRDQSDQGLLSPGHFNLTEICQTSPFISTTPKLQKESSVFIFPEQSTPKKVSPYKLTADKSPGSKPSQHQSTSTRQQVQRSYSKSDHENTDSYVGLSERRHMTKDEDPNSIPGIKYPPYVSPKGFVWPSQVSQSSSRSTSTDVRAHYPISHESTSSRPINKYEGYEEDYARLCMLRREHARAMKAYASEMCRPRELGDVMRNERFKTQRSAEEHSPNEKAIREIREDVHNKYERSISDPLYSPKHYRQILRMASRFSRERLSAYSDETEGEDLDKEENRRESWKHDYRRRLFMKDETYSPHNTDRRRVQHDYESHLVTGKTEIPKEVLDFLHSLNFHPEELENLKDYIRRGGSEAASFHPRLTSSHKESKEDLLRPPLPETEFHRRSPNERLESADFRQRQFLPPHRERQLGDINVRLACANVIEKGNHSSDSDSDDKDCKCVRIENEIRAMAMDAYSKIRRMDEFTETNTNVYDSMKVLKNIKCLCSHGRTVEEIYTGSVVFTLNCPDIDALMDLWNMYKSGTLLRSMQEAFITEEFKRRHGCEDIELKVSISKEEFLACKHELETSFQQKFLHQKSPSSFIHTRSRSEPASVAKQANNFNSPQHGKFGTLSPFRERFRSDSSVELSPRRAFQELNTRDACTPIQPLSPSKKYFPDNVFLTEEPPRSPLAPISPQPSTRKKSFGNRFQLQEQQQQENVEQNPDVNASASGTLV